MDGGEHELLEEIKIQMKRLRARAKTIDIDFRTPASPPRPSVNENKKRACVLIIGLGEVGCTIAELLAKAQVDRLILLDDGLVETKSSRFGKDCIDMSRVQAMRIRLREINPELQVSGEHLELGQGYFTSVLHGYCQGKHFGLRDVEKREEREAAVNLVVYTRRCLRVLQIVNDFCLGFPVPFLMIQNLLSHKLRLCIPGFTRCAECYAQEFCPDERIESKEDLDCHAAQRYVDMVSGVAVHTILHVVRDVTYEFWNVGLDLGNSSFVFSREPLQPPEQDCASVQCQALQQILKARNLC